MSFLVLAQIILFILIFEYFFEVFATDNAGVCKKHSALSTDRIEHAATFFIDLVFPLTLFTETFPSECFSCFWSEEDQQRL